MTSENLEIEKTSETKLKRFRVIVDCGMGCETVESIDKMLDRIYLDPRLIEIASIPHLEQEKTVMYIEFDHSKKVSTLVNFMKRDLNVENVHIKNMNHVKKNTFINAIIRQALLQKMMPDYYNRDGSDLYLYS
jgi:hypothetical protein